MSRRRRTRVVLLGLVLVAIAPGASAGSQLPPAAATPLVRLPFPRDDGTLTPYTFRLAYPLMTLVYDTLLWRDASGAPGPWLAGAVETTPDGRRVTVRLRDGAQWHDGLPVTSADVAFTFAYVASHPHPRFSSEVTAVERVDTPDPLTAVFSLRQATPDFDQRPLADVPILPKHLWEGLAPGQSAPAGLPVGSGPYRLVEHRPGERYRFEANTAYFRGPPAVTTIVVPIIASAADTITALKRRTVDMIPISLTADLATRVASLGIKVDEGPSYLGTVLMFNLRTPPFDRVEARRAVARALDLVKISRAVGRAVPADRGYLHPQSPFAPSGPLAAGVPAVDGSASSRSVLAGLGSPITVLAADNDPVRGEAGRQVVQALRGAGVPAELKLLPRDPLGKAVGEDGSPPSFRAAIWVTPVLASYDPSFLSGLFGTAGPYNYPGYRSPAFDDAAGRVAAAVDPAQRKAATADALRLLAADAPVVPLFFSQGAFAYRPAIYDGWVFIKGTGILDKRSFVEPRSSGAGRTTVEPGVGGNTSGGLSAAGVVALTVLGTAGALTVLAVILTIRSRRND